MKRKILFLSLLGCISLPAIACDICGCGAGNSYIGILPDFRKRFIGFRYQQNGVQTHLGPGGTASYLTTTETYRSMELWGATNLGNKFRLAAFIPVNFLERSGQEGTVSHQGLGDITAIGYYQLLNKKKTTGSANLLVQSLWIGAGLKLPTGEYNPEEKNIEETSLNTFQVGTGSVDFSFHAMYDIRLQDAGINTNLSYKINTVNKYDYQYGNKFTMNMLAYYKWRFGKSFSVAPNAGFLVESAGKDSNTKELRVFETGGRSLMGVSGMELSFKRISAGANFQSPLSQQLGEGSVKAKARGMVYMSYSF